MNILLTGGLGFIGSHTYTALAESKHHVVILDNLSNCRIEVLDSLESIVGRRPAFINADVRDTVLMQKVLMQNRIDAVIHFAGLKAVGESSADPINYYSNNVGGTISLIQAMQSSGVNKLIFSSSATVYGDPIYLPCDELHPTRPTNPYGRTKLQCEEILRDHVNANPNWSVVCLRYFNPIGAHSSGLIGEDPLGVPNNLLPYIAQVASGKLSFLNIFGVDYDTKDGTGERDYIHIMDLASGHASALNYVGSNKGFITINLGTGSPVSVLEIVSAFERASSKKICCKIADRRLGDSSRSYANPDLARRILDWMAQYSFEDACEDIWNYYCVSHKAK